MQNRKDAKKNPEIVIQKVHYSFLHILCASASQR